jgi:hypothetical protein
MNTLAKRIELLANVAIIVVAVLIGGVLINRYLLSNPTQAINNNEVKVGTRVSLPDVDWSKNGQTLLLALSRDCHFCSESGSFYQRLALERASGGKSRIIAVLPQTVSDGQKYLRDLAVSVDDVKQQPLSLIGVVATPTLILVDNAGIATAVWRGKLPESVELEVLKRIK